MYKPKHEKNRKVEAAVRPRAEFRPQIALFEAITTACAVQVRLRLLRSPPRKIPPTLQTHNGR
ncbi:hypothetical protein EYF80_058131 [Liparis tanakae]|uniref:Uncharacterized protein n=1 Tax=Liparis tanakae TaxID=230148 RepID=A0A4Z2ET05_9TELE|nr:hypothetical protein EYF80_058131 [Liparis tanakae]